jgi:hypothetical protein
MADRICVIATVRAPRNELLDFVRYHLAAGVDEVILFFDDPHDTVLDAVAGHPRVVAIRCDAAYWRARRVDRPIAVEHRQMENVNAGMTIARSRGFDWIIHIDSDELLFAESDIRTLLTGISASMVRFDMKEAVAEQDYYSSRFQATLFREPPTAERMKKITSIPSADLEGVLFEGEYFRAHTASKVAVRLNSGIKLMGIHGPQRQKLTEVHTGRITLLHYDCIGIDDWKRKWLRRIDASGTAAGMRPARTKQLELFKQAFGDEMAERKLYARMHKVSQVQKRLLLELGLLTVIRLEPDMFEPRREGEASA